MMDWERYTVFMALEMMNCHIDTLQGQSEPTQQRASISKEYPLEKI